MVRDKESRVAYIGGSDMSFIYGSFDVPTFQSWWKQKVTGLKIYNIRNDYTIAGNLLEEDILREAGVPEICWGIKKEKKGTIAGVNTDALEDEDDGVLTVHEAKTAKRKKAWTWLIGYAIPIGYRRQVYHAMWVCRANKGKIHVLGLDDEEYDNPFGVEAKGRVFTFDLDIGEFDVEEHERRIGYLSECYEEKVNPSDSGYKIYCSTLL